MQNIAYPQTFHLNILAADLLHDHIAAGDAMLLQVHACIADEYIAVMLLHIHTSMIPACTAPMLKQVHTRVLLHAPSNAPILLHCSSTQMQIQVEATS